MQRTTIMLPEELKRRALRRARELGISFGEFVRTCMDEGVKKPNKNKGKPRDAFFADHAVWSGPAPRDGARNTDTYLYDEDGK